MIGFTLKDYMWSCWGLAKQGKHFGPGGVSPALASMAPSWAFSLDFLSQDLLTFSLLPAILAFMLLSPQSEI